MIVTETVVNPDLRIGICGSASVGKTTLAHALARDLSLPCLREEMRDYLESSGSDLTLLPSTDVELILLHLWQQRQEKESIAGGFVADNCAIDFAAYALYYGCLSDRSRDALLTQALRNLDRYHAIFLLPWGVLPYEQDGIRPANPHLQLRYHYLLEGLLRHHFPAERLHPLPSTLLRLEDRIRWARERLAHDAPAFLVVRDVVSLRKNIHRFQTGGLHQRRILLARARPGHSKIAASLRALGAEVIESPQVSTLPLTDSAPLEAALTDLDSFDAVVLSCAAGVHALNQHLSGQGGLRILPQIVSIGEQTDAALRDLDITPHASVKGSCAEALAQQPMFFQGKHLLVITSKEGRPQLVRELASLGARVHSVAAYQVAHQFKDLAATAVPFDLIVLPSSSAVRLLLTYPSAANILHLPAVAIGSHTQNAAKECGLTRVTTTPDDTIDSLVSTVFDLLSNPEPARKLAPSL